MNNCCKLCGKQKKDLTQVRQMQTNGNSLRLGLVCGECSRKTSPQMLIHELANKLLKSN